MASGRAEIGATHVTFAILSVNRADQASSAAARSDETPTNLNGPSGRRSEPMGRNPGTSEAANLTALKVRGCDLAARFADLIEASGHVPCFKAVHMNAPSTREKSIEKLLAPRAVPHMRLAGDALRERELTSDRHRQKTIDGGSIMVVVQTF